MELKFKMNSQMKTIELFPRNRNFDTFISDMKRLAQEAGLSWSMELDDKGVALKGHGWDLRPFVSNGQTAAGTIRQFALDSDALTAVHERDPTMPRRRNGPLSKEWQDFLKATVVYYLLDKKASLSFIAGIAKVLRILAASVERDPWQLTLEDVTFASAVCDELQPAGDNKGRLHTILNVVVDGFFLADASPLMGLVKRESANRGRRSAIHLAQSKSLDSLTARKNEEKLPERRAFWELLRIVYTETPRTLNDALRFILVKVFLMCGLRPGEATQIPFDWKRVTTYLDAKGRLAGESGGLSEAMSLRHFPLKQGTTTLYERTQPVPELFREPLEQALNDAATLTAPLRATLKAQYESGRLFPMYRADQLVDAVEMYVRLTGNPIWAKHPSEDVKRCLQRYSESLNDAELAPISTLLRSTTELSPAVSRYFSPENRDAGLILRDIHGELDEGRGVAGKFLLVSDVEAYVRQAVPTKVSDLNPFKLENGTLVPPWEMLFLHPKRAVGAGRGETVIDPTMTFSVGVPDSSLLRCALGDENRAGQSLFAIYGQSEEDKALKISAYSFRHLQNTVLFREGVADTIITKRFNRRSVEQSYQYDHRSLSEAMDQLELPDEWAEVLGDSKAAEVAKLIHAGWVDGPVVKEFQYIQATEGDEAALRYLIAEADGVHVTPYGFCITSFTVDPCPNHLECFSNCRHLAASPLPSHRESVVKLYGRLQTALAAVKARPVGAVGRENQITHAEERLAGCEKLMKTSPGELVFPNGIDRSKPNDSRSVLDAS